MKKRKFSRENHVQTVTDQDFLSKLSCTLKYIKDRLYTQKPRKICNTKQSSVIIKKKFRWPDEEIVRTGCETSASPRRRSEWRNDGVAAAAASSDGGPTGGGGPRQF